MEMATKASTSDAGKELLLIINCESKLKIRAFDNNGDLVPDFSITTPYGSFHSAMGFTVIGSDLHMIGGFPPQNDNSKDRYSMKTYVLDIANIPALASGTGTDLSAYLTPAPPLNSGKLIPVVYVVRDCIYALSSAVHGPDSNYSDFEFRPLEDPAWTKLPNPPVPDDVEVKSSYASLESYALVADRSIVVSLTAGTGWRGSYVFNLASASWTKVQEAVPIGFTGQTVSCDGFFYAPSAPTFRVPAGSALQVFADHIDGFSSPVQEFKLREASPEVSMFTTHRIAVMGGVIFIVRSGCPDDVLPDYVPGGSPVYITVDRYKVSRDHSEPCITELGHSEPLRLLKDDCFRGSTVSPYCLPVSLSGYSALCSMMGRRELWVQEEEERSGMAIGISPRKVRSGRFQSEPTFSPLEI